MNYKIKYLKYKRKYLELKKFIGGNINYEVNKFGNNEIILLKSKNSKLIYGNYKIKIVNTKSIVIFYDIEKFFYLELYFNNIEFNEKKDIY
jgi:hypothetical protein